MILRLVALACAIALLGLSLGCLYPDHGRGRGPEDRHDRRSEPKRDRDHEEHRERGSAPSQQ